ncbi:Ig-like domain-containing protein, partial [Brevibacillus laterosporus]|uniref:Ig-like domain-containing protein n=1 Tax=Brevibacillus laterosporus TaxID=1465 RepID=UPI002E1DE6B7|nr:Ig-like domain-containing protein [Brevibacillus laterosporus]
MNKKVILSVLSTALVTSMATSAFAASGGIYIGGKVDRFYSDDAFIKQNAMLIADLYDSGLENVENSVLYVNWDGKVATLQELIDAKLAGKEAEYKTVTSEDFEKIGGEEGFYAVSDKGEVSTVKEMQPEQKPLTPEAILKQAEEAVAAYEAAALDTPEAIAKAEALGETAVAKVSAVADADKKAALEARVAKKKAAVDAAKAGDLTVESVSAINLIEVEVAFNKNVDEESASNLSNYAITGGLKVASAKVEGNKVLLTLEGKADQQTSYDVTIDGVKNVGKTTKTVKFFDNAAPFASNIEVVGPKTVKVHFSEPLQTVPSFTVNNGAIAVVATEFKTGAKVVTLTLGAQPTAGVNTLTVEGGLDYAGFKVEKATKEFNTAVDTTPPTVEIKQTSATKVVLEFSEEVVNLDNSNVKFYHTSKGVPAYEGKVAVDGKTATITFANPLPQGEYKLFIDYTDEKGAQIADLWGNKLTQLILTGNFVADTTPPTVTKVEGKTNTTIAVTYSETVKGATEKANYILKDAKGNTVAISNIDDKDAAKNIYVINTTSPLNGGLYTLTVKNIEDDSKNKLVEYTTSVSVADTVPPTYEGASLVSDKKVKILFSEAMDKASIENKYNYLFNGKNLDAKVKVTAIDNNTAVLLDFTDVEGATLASQTILIGRVVDAAGNPIAALQTTVTIPNATTAPQFDKAEATGKNTVKLYFKEVIKDAQATDFLVNDKAAAAVANDVVDGKSVLTLTVADNIPTTVDNVKVKTAAKVSAKNELGVSVAISETAVGDKIGPDWVSVVASDEDLNKKIDTFKLTFSEDLYVASVQDTDFNIQGYSITNIKVDGKDVIIKVKELNEEDINTKPSVAVVGSVEDMYRNVSGTFEAKEASVDNSKAELAQAIATANDKIALI